MSDCPANTDSKTVWAVIPAGGSGVRFSSKGDDKLLAKLAGAPVLLRTVSALTSAPEIGGIVIAASPQKLVVYQQLLATQAFSIPVQWVTGGSSRRASVYNALAALPAEAEIVLVHDAARPLIQSKLVSASVEAIRRGALGAVVAAPMQDTVKQVRDEGLTIQATLDRSTLWRAQTPQAFDKASLLQAHQQISPDIAVTDDAQLLELAGLGPVVIVPGDESNLKITTQDDLRLAEALLQTRAALMTS